VGLLDLFKKSWGDKSTQNQPVVIEGPGSSYDDPPPGTAPYTPAGNGWSDPHPDIVRQWQENAHRREPDPAQPARDAALYKQAPKMTDGPRDEHFVQTDPVPGSEFTKGWTDSPYRYPGKWRPEFTVWRPTNWEFQRQYQGLGQTTLNGSHFSMASNIRTYPVGGMQSAKERGRRNTYRINPDPHDETYVDMPPASELPQVTFTSEAAVPSSRAYRL